MGNIGAALRIEAANARIDAALAALVPDSEPPAHHYNRLAGEIARAEWLADTLESLKADVSEDVSGSLEAVPDFSEWTDDEVHNLAVDVGIDVTDEITRPELVAAIIGTVDIDELNEIIAPASPDSDETDGDDSDALGDQVADAALPTGDDLVAALEAKTLDELKPLAEQLGIPTSQKKADLIAAIVAKVEE